MNVFNKPLLGRHAPDVVVEGEGGGEEGGRGFCPSPEPPEFRDLVARPAPRTVNGDM